MRPQAERGDMAVSDWLRYSNQGATRNDPLAPNLVSALSFLPSMGVTMEVFSGGQEAAGEPGAQRTGSTRHDHGGAGDVFFYKDGRKLDWANPADLPIFEEIVKRGKANGLTGFGAGDGYMQPGSMHVGFGGNSVWGAGGSGANAPEWLRSAYNGSPAGPGHSVDDGHGHSGGNALAMAPQSQQEPGNALAPQKYNFATVSAEPMFRMSRNQLAPLQMPMLPIGRA